ncbi:MAG: SH3-like domain-containing protein [Hyphomicrobiaceae bacterium]
MSARFKIGDRVVVRTDSPAGHVRTPSYLKGKHGVVLRDFGAWPNPEQLAYGKPGWPRRTNYWVQFAMDEVWGGQGTYAKGDTVVAEIYEQWLEPAA